MQIWLRDRPRGSLPSGLRTASLAATGQYVSSSHTVPDRTVSPWMPSSTANSFAIQYGGVVSARLSSLVIAATLSYEIACRMKSAHAVTGSLALSNMVPVAGVNDPPQDRQAYFWVPSRLVPFLTTRPAPQSGQASRA